MDKIKFTNVGRDKWSGEISIEHTDNPDLIAEYAYREAQKHLITKWPDVEYNIETNKGEICAGYRTVGYFEVEYAKN